ncbi:MAG: hypothetical protein JRJ00_13405 [Deltaproteobacteria bacterium]|nr:hypothetical protein [Deltaproteobacteria bacterium]
MGKSKREYGNRWIAYLDILGFKKLVDQHKGNIDTFAEAIYDNVLVEITKRSDRISNSLNKKVDYAWFSDSFILFTEDDTSDSFSSIETVLWEVFEKMMTTKKMLRGALSVGEFYSNKERNTYIGPALIDAYDYAEKQKCIGLVLTPKAHDKLYELGYPINPTRFSQYQVPIKPEVVKKEKLFTRNIDHLKRYVIEKQKSAKRDEDYEEKTKVIYENTLKFIEHLESQNQA